MKRPLLTTADVLLLTLLLLAVGLSFRYLPAVAQTPAARTVRVQSPHGEWLLPLRPDRTVSIDGRRSHLQLEFRDGRVRVGEAYCPRGICLDHRWLGGPDDALICVPEQVVVRSVQRGACDAVTR